MKITLQSFFSKTFSHKQLSFLFKDIAGAFDDVWTHNWQSPTDYMSQTLSTAARRPLIWLYDP